DESPLGIWRDDQAGDSKSIAVLVFLRGREMVLPSAVVVPGDEDRGGPPVLAPHNLVHQADHPVLPRRHVLGRVLAYLFVLRHNPADGGEFPPYDIGRESGGVAEDLCQGSVRDERLENRERVPPACVQLSVVSPGDTGGLKFVEDAWESEPGGAIVRHDSARLSGDEVEMVGEARPLDRREVVVHEYVLRCVIPVVWYLVVVEVAHRRGRRRGVDEAIHLPAVKFRVSTPPGVADVTRRDVHI